MKKQTRWTRTARPPAREGDRFLVRQTNPLKKGTRQFGKEFLVEVKGGKLHYVLKKEVEFLSIAMPLRPDLGDEWRSVK